MKKQNILTIYALLLACFLGVWGCDDDNDPFTGTDNYVVSFRLTQNGEVLKAALTGDSIILKAPVGVSLAGASAEVMLSENARIMPSPDSVANWNEEALFEVTSASGVGRVYHYFVVRESVPVEGSVTLATQEEVDAFGESGVTEVGGNLIIGRSGSEEVITSLLPLNKLVRVGHDLKITEAYTGIDLMGLENLEEVGSLLITAKGDIDQIYLPALKKVGLDLTVQNNLAQEFVCPLLEEVGRNFTLAGTVRKLDVGSLKTVDGDMAISGFAMDRVSFPRIARVGGTLTVGLADSYTVDFPALEKCNALNVKPTTGSAVFSVMNALNMPLLKEIPGALSIGSCKLVETNFPVLESVGSLALDGSDIRVIRFPALKTIVGNCTLNELQYVNNLDGFEVLATVGGSFTITNLATLKNVRLPATLGEFSELKLTNLEGLETLDVSAVKAQTLTLEGSTLTKVSLVGGEVFPGILKLACSSTKVVTRFPPMSGIKEVGGIDLSGAKTLAECEITSIRKVNGDFTTGTSMAYLNSCKKFVLADLEEVTGNFTLSKMPAVEEVNIPKLQKVGGNVEIFPFSTTCTVLDVPALESVGGKMTIYSWASYVPFTELSFGSIKSIGSTLTIMVTPPLPMYANNDITNMDGFATLESVKEVTINFQSALTSYAGFKKAIDTIEKFTTRSNGYTVTLDDLKAGKWTKE